MYSQFDAGHKLKKQSKKAHTRHDYEDIGLFMSEKTQNRGKNKIETAKIFKMHRQVLKPLLLCDIILVETS